MYSIYQKALVIFLQQFLLKSIQEDSFNKTNRLNIKKYLIKINKTNRKEN